MAFDQRGCRFVTDKDCISTCGDHAALHSRRVSLFFYAGFLFLACKKIASNIKGPVATAGNIIAKGALVAGFLDILENAGMLYTLSYHDSSAIAFATTFTSVIKWVLALIAVLYVLTGLLVLAYRRIKH